MNATPRIASLPLVLLVAVTACGDSDGAKDTRADTSSTDTATETSAGDTTTTTTTTDTTTTTTADATPDGEVQAGCFQLADGSCVVESFKNPPVLAPDEDGVYQLALVPSELMVDGKRHCGRTYNGVYPAPTIDIPARAGNTPRRVRVDLKNRFTKAALHALSSDPCTCADRVSGQSCDPASSGHGHGGGSATCECKTPDGHACHYFDFNTTNLHGHGLHVRPDYATGGGCVEGEGLACRSCSGDRDAAPRECFLADDVISRVGPGEGVQHRWDLDEDGTHHEGLDWYHPHIHGSTAIQVASGATGALIVRGPIDAMPGIANATERIMILMTPPTAYEPLPAGQACDEDHITFDDFVVLGTTSEKQLNLINGVRRPRLVMPPGQIERWRFLYGAFLDEVFLALFRGKDSNCANLDFEAGPIGLTQIGRDGIALAKPASGQDWPYAPPYVFMSPGYRIDALLDGSGLVDGDTLCLMAGRFLQEDDSGTTNEEVGIREPPTLDDILQKVTNGDLVAIVNVAASAGTATETTMPDLDAIAARSLPLSLQDGEVDALARCAQAEAETDPTKIDQAGVLWAIFAFGEGYDPCGCKDHNINCRNFETTERADYPYDRVLELGKVDHWRLISGFDGHPFHIHINPFLVCPLPPAGAPHRNTSGRLFEPPFAHWRDTYLVNLDRQVDLLTEYKKFTGDFVFHCHKLTHEDHGMMELIRVCDPATESCDSMCDGRPCGWRECAEGDASCAREVAINDCFLDPTRCLDMVVRCQDCTDDGTCPPGAHCGDMTHTDGTLRCEPGCQFDIDCAVTDRCGDGACVPAPPCAPPCGPGKSCRHGTCR